MLAAPMRSVSSFFLEVLGYNGNPRETGFAKTVLSIVLDSYLCLDFVEMDSLSFLTTFWVCMCIYI